MPSSGGELAGRSIVVTRAVHQSGELAAALAARGAEVIELPTIEIRRAEDLEPLDRALGELDAYAMLILGSKNAAELVFDRASALGVAVAIPIACVGAKTKAYVEKHTSAEVLAPETHRAEALAELVARKARARIRPGIDAAGGSAAREPHGDEASRAGPREPHEASRGGTREPDKLDAAGGSAALEAREHDTLRERTTETRVLFPRAAEGREVLIDSLAALGIVTDAPAIYHIVPAAPADRSTIDRLSRADAFTFLSGETLRAFLQVVPEPEARALLDRALVAVIGPVARDKAEALSIRVDLVPETATIDALVAALAAHLGPHPDTRPV